MTADRFSAPEAAPWGAADMALRTRAVRLARGWLGTPYCHQASVKGAGCDCLGLVRGLWRALYGPEPEALPPYTPDWGETDGREMLLDACHRFLVPVESPGLGDLLILRMRMHGPAKHVGLLSAPWLEPGRMIHAYSGHGVVETYLTPAWLRRMAGAFRFPALEDT